MKRIIQLIVSSALLMSAGSYAANVDSLTGEQEDACSALLCLSSSLSGGISECTPPLTKYYSITAKKMVDTIKKRKDFLKMCPESDQEGMPDLIESISQGAGRCDAEQLNEALVEQRTVTLKCKTNSGKSQSCTYEQQYRIKNKMPSYCSGYVNNANTDVGLHYEGSPEWKAYKDFKNSETGKWFN